MSSGWPILLWWSWECVLYLIIIKWQVWIINHCLGSGHETMVRAVCLTVFLRQIYIEMWYLQQLLYFGNNQAHCMPPWQLTVWHSCSHNSIENPEWSNQHEWSDKHAKYGAKINSKSEGKYWCSPSIIDWVEVHKKVYRSFKYIYIYIYIYSYEACRGNGVGCREVRWKGRQMGKSRMK